MVSRRRRLQRRLPVGAVPSALLVASMPSSVIKLTNTHYRPPLPGGVTRRGFESSPRN